MLCMPDCGSSTKIKIAAATTAILSLLSSLHGLTRFSSNFWPHKSRFNSKLTHARVEFNTTCHGSYKTYGERKALTRISSLAIREIAARKGLLWPLSQPYGQIMLGSQKKPYERHFSIILRIFRAFQSPGNRTSFHLTKCHLATEEFAQMRGERDQKLTSTQCSNKSHDQSTFQVLI